MQLKSLATSFVLAIASATVANAQVEIDREAAALLAADILAPWAEDEDGPGAIVQVAVDGEPILVEAAGIAHLEHEIPITSQTRFQIASVSKQFTAYAIVKLAQDGEVDLDASVADYIPEAAQYADVTLRDLLAHTHGIRGALSLVGASGLRPQDVVTHEQAMDLMLRQRAMNFAPGERFAYSNGGFILLAEVVQRVTGKSLDEYCRETVCAPLGMDETGFFDRLEANFPNRAESYYWTGETYGHFAFNYALSGSTGLVSTPGDLALWTAFLDDLAEIDPAFYASFHTLGVLNDGSMTSYAYGQERRVYRGLETWSHGGRDAGYRAFLMRVPSHDLSITVLSNVADFDVAGTTYAVLDTLLEDQLDPVIEKASTPTRAQLEQYAGDYALFPGLIFSLRIEGDTLVLSILGQVERLRLSVRSDHAFEFNPGGQIALVFDPAGEGPATGFDYQIGQMGKLRADRVELVEFSAEGIDLTAYEGSYYSAELSAAYDVAVEDGQLVLRHPALGAIALTAYQPDTFTSVSNFHQQIAFARDADGTVDGFDLAGVLMEGISFVRVR